VSAAKKSAAEIGLVERNSCRFENLVGYTFTKSPRV
jgi:hypothetical protein